MWWAFADPHVHWVGNQTDRGVRYRKTIGAWRDTDICGQVLLQSALSTRLTQVAAYRQTICNVAEAEYVLRKINAQTEPVIARTQRAISELHDVTEQLIERLHWRDFEILVDLIFARSGWLRVSELGGSQKDADLILEQVATGERAFVQVKSKAGAATFEASRDAYLQDGSFTHMFFVCHSPVGVIPEPDEPFVNYWSGSVLAALTVRTGLTNWLLERSS